MRKRRKSKPVVPGRVPKSQKSADWLLAERDALLRRLSYLDASLKTQPGYRTAKILLNSKFRKSTPSTRVSVLQAAAFMIDILQRMPL